MKCCEGGRLAQSFCPECCVSDVSNNCCVLQSRNSDESEQLTVCHQPELSSAHIGDHSGHAIKDWTVQEAPSCRTRRHKRCHWDKSYEGQAQQLYKQPRRFRSEELTRCDNDDVSSISLNHKELTCVDCIANVRPSYGEIFDWNAPGWSQQRYSRTNRQQMSHLSSEHDDVSVYDKNSEVVTYVDYRDTLSSEHLLRNNILEMDPKNRSSNARKQDLNHELQRIDEQTSCTLKDDLNSEPRTIEIPREHRHSHNGHKKRHAQKREKKRCSYPEFVTEGPEKGKSLIAESGPSNESKCCPKDDSSSKDSCLNNSVCLKDSCFRKKVGPLKVNLCTKDGCCLRDGCCLKDGCYPKDGCCLKNGGFPKIKCCLKNGCCPKDKCCIKNGFCLKDGCCLKNSCCPKDGCCLKDRCCLKDSCCLNDNCCHKEGCSKNSCCLTDGCCFKDFFCSKNSCYLKKNSCCTEDGCFIKDSCCLSGRCCVKDGCCLKDGRCLNERCCLKDGCCGCCFKEGSCPVNRRCTNGCGHCPLDSCCLKNCLKDDCCRRGSRGLNDGCSPTVVCFRDDECCPGNGCCDINDCCPNEDWCPSEGCCPQVSSHKKNGSRMSDCCPTVCSRNGTCCRTIGRLGTYCGKGDCCPVDDSCRIKGSCRWGSSFLAFDAEHCENVSECGQHGCRISNDEMSCQSNVCQTSCDASDRCVRKFVNVHCGRCPCTVNLGSAPIDCSEKLAQLCCVTPNVCSTTDCCDDGLSRQTGIRSKDPCCYQDVATDCCSDQYFCKKSVCNCCCGTETLCCCEEKPCEPEPEPEREEVQAIETKATAVVSEEIIDDQRMAVALVQIMPEEPDCEIELNDPAPESQEIILQHQSHQLTDGIKRESDHNIPFNEQDSARDSVHANAHNNARESVHLHANALENVLDSQTNSKLEHLIQDGVSLLMHTIRSSLIDSTRTASMGRVEPAGRYSTTTTVDTHVRPSVGNKDNAEIKQEAASVPPKVSLQVADRDGEDSDLTNFTKPRRNTPYPAVTYDKVDKLTFLENSNEDKTSGYQKPRRDTLYPDEEHDKVTFQENGKEDKTSEYEKPRRDTPQPNETYDKVTFQEGVKQEKTSTYQKPRRDTAHADAAYAHIITAGRPSIKQNSNMPSLSENDKQKDHPSDAEQPDDADLPEDGDAMPQQISQPFYDNFERNKEEGNEENQQDDQEMDTQNETPESSHGRTLLQGARNSLIKTSKAGLSRTSFGTAAKSLGLTRDSSILEPLSEDEHESEKDNGRRDTSTIEQENQQDDLEMDTQNETPESSHGRPSLKGARNSLSRTSKAGLSRTSFGTARKSLGSVRDSSILEPLSEDEHEVEEDNGRKKTPTIEQENQQDDLEMDTQNETPDSSHGRPSLQGAKNSLTQISKARLSRTSLGAARKESWISAGFINLGAIV